MSNDASEYNEPSSSSADDQYQAQALETFRQNSESASEGDAAAEQSWSQLAGDGQGGESEAQGAPPEGTRNAPEAQGPAGARAKSKGHAGKQASEYAAEFMASRKPEARAATPAEQEREDFLTAEPPKNLSEKGKNDWKTWRDRAARAIESREAKNAELQRQLEALRSSANPGETAAARAPSATGAEDAHTAQTQGPQTVQQQTAQVSQTQAVQAGQQQAPQTIEQVAQAAQQAEQLRHAEQVRALDEQAKALARQEEDRVFSEVGQKVSRAFEPFQKVDGNEAWNAQVAANEAAAKKFFQGDMSLQELGEIAYYGVGAKVIHQMFHNLRGKYNALAEENSALKAAQPDAGSSRRAPGPGDAPRHESLAQMGERVFGQNMGS